MLEIPRSKFTVSMDNFVIKNSKKLRYGFSTGSCATAAASAATLMLLTKQQLDYASIEMPDGTLATFEIKDLKLEGLCASCAVIKDAGDDPDVTDGLKICAEVSWAESGLEIKGGDGVGLVTKPGLLCPVGDAAINPVPRRMITSNLQKILDDIGFPHGLKVTISIPGGKEVAQKTFNPRLGIVGGLSVLGTTGRVEPMSEKAIIDTIKICIDQKHLEDAENILIAPGNYGLNYLNNYGLNKDKAVKISNFIGETLDYLTYKGFKRALIVGHIGKMVKIAAGVMNTHSSYADARLETLAAHSARLGAGPELIEELFNCSTTKTALEILKEKPFFDQLCRNIVDKIQSHLTARVFNTIQFEVVLVDYDNQLIAQSAKVNELLTRLLKNPNNFSQA